MLPAVELIQGQITFSVQSNRARIGLEAVSSVLCVCRKHRLSVVVIYRPQDETVATETTEEANVFRVIVLVLTCV